MEILDAEYKEQGVKAFINNPLIESLPLLPASRAELIRSLAYYPDYSYDERFADKQVRINSLSTINDIYQPVPTSLEIYERIDFAIRNGYKNRNVFSKSYIQEIYDDHDRIYGSGIVASSNCQAEGFAIFGSSGCGKTTTIQRVTELYKPIVHTEYKGIMYICYSIPIITVTCPHDASIKGLIHSVLYEVDVAIGTNYFEKSVKSRNTTDVLILRLKEILRCVNLGCLCIDEVQNLSIQKSGGKERILNMLLILSSISLPIILIGTAKAIEMFNASGFRLSRRLISNGGGIIVDRFENDKSWKLFLRSIWKYQYTSIVNGVDEFIDLFYSLTIGVPSLAKSLYIAVQKSAINSENETITKELIMQTFNKEFRLIIPMVSDFMSGNQQKMLRHEDMLREGLGNEIIDLDLTNRMDEKLDKNIVEERVVKTINSDAYNSKMTYSNIEGDMRDLIDVKAEDESNYDVLMKYGFIDSNSMEVFGI